MLRVLYLIFNEGYASSTHANRVRGELCDEALRLVELIEQMLPAEPEVVGLHALMLFHDARRATRVDESGEAVLLEAQDRSRWDTRKVLLGLNLLDAALRHRVAGPYQLQAAIAAEHARAPTWEATNWVHIRSHYDALYALDPSPVIALNRCIAIAYTDGDETGLRAIEAVKELGALDEYAPLSTRRFLLLEPNYCGASAEGRRPLPRLNVESSFLRANRSAAFWQSGWLNSGKPHGCYRRSNDMAVGHDRLLAFSLRATMSRAFEAYEISP